MYDIIVVGNNIAMLLSKYIN